MYKQNDLDAAELILSQAEDEARDEVSFSRVL
jgi:hypothetical protein